jgi:hypothetical protein
MPSAAYRWHYLALPKTSEIGTLPPQLLLDLGCRKIAWPFASTRG